MSGLPADAAPAKPITIKSLIPSAFLPAMIFEIGNGAMAPILALTALHLGASPKTAGFTLSLLGIGQILGDVPAAALANRVGDRRAMVIAATLALVAQLSCVVAPTVILLDVALLVIGMSTAVFYLARQAYLTEVVSVGIRARAMSTLGGSHRIGLFIGPFIGAAAIHFVGLHGAFFVAVVASALTGLVLVIVPDLPGSRAAGPGIRRRPDRADGRRSPPVVRHARPRRGHRGRGPRGSADRPTALGPTPRTVGRADEPHLRHRERCRHVACSIRPERSWTGRAASSSPYRQC